MGKEYAILSAIAIVGLRLPAADLLAVEFPNINSRATKVLWSVFVRDPIPIFYI